MEGDHVENMNNHNVQEIDLHMLGSELVNQPYKVSV